MMRGRHPATNACRLFDCMLQKEAVIVRTEAGVIDASKEMWTCRAATRELKANADGSEARV
jgi:hypothetical protein